MSANPRSHRTTDSYQRKLQPHGDWLVLPFRNVCAEAALAGVDVKTFLLALWDGEEYQAGSFVYRCVVTEQPAGKAVA